MHTFQINLKSVHFFGFCYLIVFIPVLIIKSIVTSHKVMCTSCQIHPKCALVDNI